MRVGGIGSYSGSESLDVYVQSFRIAYIIKSPNVADLSSKPENTVEVLIAEDEESFIEALQINLSREGFNVRIARDGMEALDSFKEKPSDIVLLDVMLPRMSGLDVCRQIRTFSAVPIIMVTAKSTEIDTVVGLEIGADDYVAKPFRIHELISRMRAVLRRSAQDKINSQALDTAANPIIEDGRGPVATDILFCYGRE